MLSCTLGWDAVLSQVTCVMLSRCPEMLDYQSVLGGDKISRTTEALGKMKHDQQFLVPKDGWVFLWQH